MRSAMGEQDFVFGNHPGHGHYLARYEDPHGLLAETMGRESARRSETTLRLGCQNQSWRADSVPLRSPGDHFK
ncbi:hypothetical protein [Actinocrispum sp. NPDC049592]|uniref:hypothetical protein n=1 Tax=Actinocrispum sp. NPDC049592 TaxID=3154835 RepID=UPI00341286A2